MATNRISKETLRQGLHTLVTCAETTSNRLEVTEAFAARLLLPVLKEAREADNGLGGRRTVGDPTEALAKFTEGVKSQNRAGLHNITRRWNRADYYAVYDEAFSHYGLSA